MFKVDFTDYELKSMEDLIKKLESIFKTKFVHSYQNIEASYTIKNNLDFASQEIETIPYKEITFVRNYVLTSTNTVKITEEMIEKMDAINIDLIEHWINKFCTILDGVYLGFRLVEFSMIPPIETNITGNNIKIEIKTTFSFNPKMFRFITYNAKYDDDIIKKFNEITEKEGLILDYNKKFKVKDTQLTYYGHPFSVLREILNYAFPETSFIALPDIRRGIYRVVHIKNYKYAKIMDVVENSENIRPFINLFEMMAAPKTISLKTSVVTKFIGNDFNMVFVSPKINLASFKKLTRPVYKPAKSLAVTPKGQIIHSKVKNKTEEKNNKEVNLNPSMPSGLFELAKEMSFDNRTVTMDITFATQNFLRRQKYTSIIPLIADITYFNLYNTYLIFPTYAKLTLEKLTVSNWLIKRIEENMKFTFNVNLASARAGIKINTSIDIKLDNVDFLELLKRLNLPI